MNPDWITFSRTLSGATHSGQNEKHPPVNTLNVKTTTLLPPHPPSIKKNLRLRLEPGFCTNSLTEQTAVSHFPLILHTQRQREYVDQVTQQEPWHALWWKHSHTLSLALSHAYFFYGGNTYCSDSVCFSSCLDFLLEKRARRSISISCCSEWTTQWSRELIRGQKSMRRRRRTDREKEKNCNLWQRLWLSNEAELKVPEAHAKWHIPSERESGPANGSGNTERCTRTAGTLFSNSETGQLQQCPDIGGEKGLERNWLHL